jgi:hypothetical protein
MRELALGLATLAGLSALGALIYLALEPEPVRAVAAAGLALATLAAFLHRRRG